ncbi:MAG: SDR family oxidoreductase [bacterium]
MKYALITGSSKGVGRSIALNLAKHGYTIFINYISDTQNAEQVMDEIKAQGGTSYLVPGDVSSEADVKIIFENIIKITNQLDVLVNNAAIDSAKLIEEASVEELKKIIAVDLVGPILMSKFALPFLKKAEKSQIINIGSRLGKEKTSPTTGAYGASKAGLIKFSQVCVLEWSKYGIKVNVINPSLMDTNLTRNINMADDKFQGEAEKNPMKRNCTPEDIANVVEFLISPKAEFINGEVIGVNGGGNLL